MTADFETTIEMKGTEPELLSLLKVLRKYAVDNLEQWRSGRDSIFLVNVSFNHISRYVSDFTEEELTQIVKETNGQIKIGAGGPYGFFTSLDDVGLFEEMADAAPTAWFIGEVSGDASLEAEFENGVLTVTSYDLDDMEDFDEEGDIDGEISIYIPIPAVDNRALYVTQRINKNKVNIVFEKHSFAISKSCINRDLLAKGIENLGGKVRKNIGKTTHYLVIGENITGYDRMVTKVLLFNSEDGTNIEAVTEEELFEFIK